nr:DUF4268 domain-containing protein [Photobacterium carnosum]
MNAKEAEEKNTEAELKNRHRIRIAFWEQALEAMKSSQCDLFNNINPSKDHWLSAGSGVRSCPFSLIFGIREARVEFSMSRSEMVENKFIFDHLLETKLDIEVAFGSELEWLRLDNKKASRIQFKLNFDGYNRDNWPEIIAWMVKHMTMFEGAFKQPLLRINRELRQATFQIESEA